VSIKKAPSGRMIDPGLSYAQAMPEIFFCVISNAYGIILPEKPLKNPIKRQTLPGKVCRLKSLGITGSIFPAA